MKVYRDAKHRESSGKYYLFNQNNSGGSFAFDEKSGISHLVFIEADDVEDASARAQRIGIYFDGISKGYDCYCCGDRWYEPWSDRDVVLEGNLGSQILYYMDSQFAHHWQKTGCPEIFVHKMDGTIVGFWFDDETDEAFLADSREEMKELEG